MLDRVRNFGRLRHQIFRRKVWVPEFRSGLLENCDEAPHNASKHGRLPKSKVELAFRLKLSRTVPVLVSTKGGPQHPRRKGGHLGHQERV